MFLTGQRTLHHRSDVLETVVLVNPSEDTVLSEVVFFFFTTGRKHMVDSVLWKLSTCSSDLTQTC